MKYETPELTALTPAINAIQGTGPVSSKTGPISASDSFENESVAAYLDWE